MSSKMVRQTAFTAGEADEITWKRTDVAEYLTAAQSLLNAEVGTTGLARKRKGTSFKRNATGEAIFTSTMYEFVDKNGNYYIVLGADFKFFIYSVPSSETPVINFEGLFVVTYTGDQVVYHDETVSMVQEIVTPYDGADLFGLDYTQDNDSLILTYLPATRV